MTILHTGKSWRPCALLKQPCLHSAAISRRKPLCAGETAVYSATQQSALRVQSCSAICTTTAQLHSNTIPLVTFVSSLANRIPWQYATQIKNKLFFVFQNRNMNTQVNEK
jgi:hypothetical protein